MNDEIESLRNSIDALDNEFIALLQKRAELAVQMGRLKQANGKGTFDPDRELSILSRLCTEIHPPLTNTMVSSLFQVIFSISRALQEQRKIAYLGPEESYSYEAATSVFPCDAILLPRNSIEEVIQDVIAERADLGIVPVENSSEGMISQTLDLMVSARLFVVREILLAISHCLLSRTSMGKIERVFSPPQALAQCRQYLRANLSQAVLVETASVVDAACAAAAQESSAAIASAHAGQRYGLTILAANINDYPKNITRFWVLSRNILSVQGKVKTSLILLLENKPGSLYHVLGAFASQGINLTKIESRPSRKDPWKHITFIDFQGGLHEEHVQKAMQDIKTYTSDVIVLGSYPEGGIPD